MTAARIRKLLTIVPPPRDDPDGIELGAPRRAAALAVIENPCRGDHISDLALLGIIGHELAGWLGRKQINAFGHCFEAITVQVSDAPHPHEIVIAVAVTDRVLAPPRAAGKNVVSFYSARRRWPSARRLRVS